MHIWLMRHGEALSQAEGGGEDAERALSPAGQRQVEQVALGLKQRGVSVEGVLSSPLVRARQTAEQVSRVLGISSWSTLAALSPSNDFRKVLSTLRAEKRRSLLLVSHHPDLTALVSLLTGQDPLACPPFQTASVAALTWNPRTSEGSLDWFQTAEQLSPTASWEK